MSNNKAKEVQELFDKTWPKIGEKNFAKKNPEITKLIVKATFESLWDVMNEEREREYREWDSTPPQTKQSERDESEV